MTKEIESIQNRYVNDVNFKKYMMMDDLELDELVCPTTVERRLRTRYWIEFERSHDPDLDGKFRLENVIGGLCSEDFFYDLYLNNVLKAAWLLRMPEDYREGNLRRLSRLNSHLDEIIDLPITEYVLDEDGNPKLNSNNEPIIRKINTQVANMKLRLHDKLTDRVYGAVVQKQLLVTAKSPSQSQLSASKKLSKREELELLKAREREIMALPEVSSVSVSNEKPVSKSQIELSTQENKSENKSEKKVENVE